MPVLTHRQYRQVVNAKPSIELPEAMNEPLWTVEEDFQCPQKEMNFPMAPIGKVPSRKDSMNNLRINTYTSSDLHQRYMESEEEPSPSPDSDTESNNEELKHKVPATMTVDAAEPIVFDDTAEIATAIPIMVVGRPKLVDITDFAPMHKRKRTEKIPLSRSAVKNPSTYISSATKENAHPVAEEANKITDVEEHLPKRKDSLPGLIPDSWLPDDVNSMQEGDHYFPDLELRNPPSYTDYDPYSLDPPRLSPRNSHSFGKKPGSVARARNSSNPPLTTASNNGWKGLSRTLSIAKRQTLHRGDQQAAKKPKMIARAANEREDPLTIPAFPYDEREL